MDQEKTVHIISHTHWDREWYLPYEKHHAKLIELMDTLIETLETKSGYQSFHLDGQTIVLDDYLQIRPEMRLRVQQLIDEQKLQIGPWYILQDEFLTSSESNVRNLQYGLKDAEAWGSFVKLGYFPDSFGNIGQAPQLLQQAGIDYAAFGRGVKPTGFNNMVSGADAFESPYSEMIWRAPDGSSVVGVLFSNWYCNGNEVPVNKEEAKAYWNERLAAMEDYASTSHLLLMNGCDHQPIQTDLPEAIQTAKALYPDITFQHSDFSSYIDVLEHHLPEQLKTIDGELRSQQTNGWGTLVNTASSRLYLKQMNRKGEVLLEKVAEPLAAFASILGSKYDHGMFEYAWKTLMQNHPHDSICGCSVDEVHRGMVTRFEKSKHITETLIDESLTFIEKHIDTTAFKEVDENALPFTVFNTSGRKRTGVVSVILDVKREYFADGVMKEQLKTFPLGDRVIVDAEGNVYDCRIEDMGIEFDYALPKDQFRQSYMVRRINVTFQAEAVPALGYKTFACVKKQQAADENQTLVTGKHTMENKYIHATIEDNGSITMKDKQNGRIYRNLCIFEDTGDIGNEYMYKQSADNSRLTTNDSRPDITLVTDTSFQAVYQITHHWEIPISADSLLKQEQQEVVEFTERKAARSKETIPFLITTMVMLTKDGTGLDVQSHFDNQAKDHRLRVLFPTDIVSSHHAADSIFEVANRANEPTEVWTNPDYSQHQQAFIEVGEETAGLTIANHGLTEYEVLRDGRNTVALTLLRSVGELGDWGHFPTPEAQCLGKHTVSFKMIPHQGKQTKFASYQGAYQYQIPWSVKQAEVQTGDLPPVNTFMAENNNTDKLAFSSMKVALHSTDTMMRWYNLSDEEETLDFQASADFSEVYKSNIIEAECQTLKAKHKNTVTPPVKPHEIITIGLKK